MFDEIFDMFDRDGGRGRPAGEQRGWRGFLGRLFGGGDGDDDAPRRSRPGETDDYDGGPERRRRDNDGFDFGD